MSLLSLLIALAAEKSLSSPFWRFDYYYQKYAAVFQRYILQLKRKDNVFAYTLFLLIPVASIYAILSLIDNTLLHFIISTLILIVCFGCFTTRSSYKQYLHAASRGEETTSTFHHQQLLEDKNLHEMSFGQALIWLNYRYYIAIMLFFTLFGATGAVFYRLLTTVIEQQNANSLAQENTKEEKANAPHISAGCKHYHRFLFLLDWLPVRLTSFGYMFVGHFAKAFPIWLESFFDGKKPTHKVLTDVAQKSEDRLIDKGDCIAEPCLLVRLSKRNVLLLLAAIASLTLFGVIH